MPGTSRVSQVVPKAIQDELDDARQFVSRLTPNLSEIERHELLQKMRARRVVVRGPGSPREGLMPRDPVYVTEYLYAALRDLDRAWTRFHDCRTENGSKKYIAPAERRKIEEELSGKIEEKLFAARKVEERSRARVARGVKKVNQEVAIARAEDPRSKCRTAAETYCVEEVGRGRPLPNARTIRMVVAKRLSRSPETVKKYLAGIREEVGKRF